MSALRIQTRASTSAGPRRGYAAVQSIVAGAFLASLFVIALAYGELVAAGLAASQLGYLWGVVAHIFNKLQSFVAWGYCAGAGLTLVGAFTKHRIVNASQVAVVAVLGGLVALL